MSEVITTTIQVVNEANRHLHGDILDQMFRLRHQIYVERRGWNALARPDKREIDEFDTEAANYLLWLDDARQVYGGVRLLPTEGPHLLADVFPHLVQFGSIPRGPDIFEMTRWFAVPCRKARMSSRAISSEVGCAMIEYLLSLGVSSMTTVCDTFFLPWMIQAGWDPMPLGLPTRYPEGTCVAAQIAINPAMLQSSRRTRGVRHSLLGASQKQPMVHELAS